MANFRGYPGRHVRFFKDLGPCKAGETYQILYNHHRVALIGSTLITDPKTFAQHAAPTNEEQVIVESIDPKPVKKGWFLWLK